MAFTVINKVAIERQFTARGQVGIYANRLRKQAEGVARARTPRAAFKHPTKSVNMASQNFSTFIYQGNKAIRLTIGNKAPYAVYVHEGTNGSVASPGSNLAIQPAASAGLRPARGRGNVAFRKSVRGQSAQPWITESTSYVLTLHGHQSITV